MKPLLKGEIFAAEYLTEPRGGSDFFGTITKTENKGDYFLVNGQKHLFVGTEGPGYFLVYAKTDPDAKTHKALSCLIVDHGPGVETKYLYGLMGCRSGGAGRLVFNDVKISKKYIIEKIIGAYPIFKTMMIPEHLGTAVMTIGSARPALDVATSYTTKRKAFGTTINNIQGVNFQVVEAAMSLDASRSMIYTTACAVDQKTDSNTIRRMVSESKKFVTEACQKVAHNSMQVIAGSAIPAFIRLNELHGISG